MIIGQYGTGGLVGIDVASVINDSYSSAIIDGYYYSGGLVGFLTYQPSDESCNSIEWLKDKLSDLTFNKHNKFDQNTIDNSYSGGNVSGHFYVGGLVGFLTHEAIVSNCFSNSNVTGSGHYIGGLAGTNQHLSTIYSSYSTGDVISASTLWSWAGGLVGENWDAKLVNCYSTSNVSGSELTGGLVGENIYSFIENCYSVGSVTSSTDDVGGLVAAGYGTDINNYWNIETSGQLSSDMGMGRTTAEMTYPYDLNTFLDWDFVEIWSADVTYEMNSGYPYLSGVTVDVSDDYINIPYRPTMTNYPNPFNPKTTIQYSLSEDTEHIELSIYNIRGQHVRTLIAATPHLKGEYQILWDGKSDNGQPVSTGIYFYQLITPEFHSTRKMMLLK